MARRPARAPLGQLGARERQDEHAVPGGPVEQVLDEVEEAVVGPVHVLDSHHHRARARTAVRRTSASRRTAPRVRVRARRTPSRTPSALGDECPLGGIRDPALEPGGQLGAGLLGRERPRPTPAAGAPSRPAPSRPRRRRRADSGPGARGRCREAARRMPGTRGAAGSCPPRPGPRWPPAAPRAGSRRRGSSSLTRRRSGSRPTNRAVSPSRSAPRPEATTSTARHRWSGSVLPLSSWWPASW